MDKILLGNRVREIRKKKNITLKELAEGICSIGKMSYIENGITEPSSEEIELICKKLEISSEDLLPKSESIFLNEIKLIFHEIENSIELGFYDRAKKHISDLKTNQEIHRRDLLELSYLEALLAFEEEKYIFSMELLENLLTNKPSNSFEYLTISKAYNLLGIIYNELGNYNKSINMYQQALDICNNRQLEFKILFNLAICQATRGHTSDARITIGLIQNKRKNFRYPKLTYLSFLLNVIDGDYNSIEEIFDLRNELFESKDYDTFLRTQMFFVYMADKDPKTFERYISLVDEFITDQINNTSNNLKISSRLTIQLLQALISNYLDKKEIIKAETLLDYVLALTLESKSEKDNALSYFLKAKLMEETTSNKELQKKWLTRSINELKASEYSIFAGIIYYELASLEDTKHDYWQLASENFYKSMVKKHLNTLRLSVILPRALY
ncbi:MULTISPECIES: helix-turn-helix transcriptional regulator [Bacillus]|uniref:helix-turn-helix transcriptional regulator n=1 Tax=Bacillus TaxID=1386 RepID=UPI000C77A2AE|nr:MULTISPECIES: helix-turn-helix transcriptional regulator [Bacillus]MCP1161249.1 helix-turn-helix transcriptional regulator [Bacillus infantis]PLR70570.1 hypothetical protein CYJ37_23865 [Bacillus sp. UMB0728]